MDEVGDGDEVNAPYQDQFPLFQPVCTFPMIQMMAHNSQKEWRSRPYKHNNDYNGTEYVMAKIGGKWAKMAMEMKSMLDTRTNSVYSSLSRASPGTN